MAKTDPGADSLARAALFAQKTIANVQLGPTISVLDARQKLRAVIARLQELSDSMHESHKFALLAPNSSGTNFDEGTQYSSKVSNVISQLFIRSLCSHESSVRHRPE